VTLGANINSTAYINAAGSALTPLPAAAIRASDQGSNHPANVNANHQREHDGRSFHPMSACKEVIKTAMQTLDIDRPNHPTALISCPRRHHPHQRRIVQPRRGITSIGVYTGDTRPYPQRHGQLQYGSGLQPWRSPGGAAARSTCRTPRRSTATTMYIGKGLRIDRAGGTGS